MNKIKDRKVWIAPKIEKISVLKDTKLGWGAEGRETWTNWFGS